MDIEKELKIKNLYEKDTKISEILKICKCSSATVNKVREKYNSEICAVLKKNKVSCAEIIDFSYEALNEVLDK